MVTDANNLFFPVSTNHQPTKRSSTRVSPTEAWREQAHAPAASHPRPQGATLATDDHTVPARTVEAAQATFVRRGHVLNTLRGNLRSAAYTHGVDVSRLFDHGRRSELGVDDIRSVIRCEGRLPQAVMLDPAFGPWCGCRGDGLHFLFQSFVGSVRTFGRRAQHAPQRSTRRD